MARDRERTEQHPLGLIVLWGVVVPLVLMAVGLYDMTHEQTLMRFGAGNYYAEGSHRSGLAAHLNGLMLLAAALALHAQAWVVFGRRRQARWPALPLLKRTVPVLWVLFVLLLIAAHWIAPLLERA